MPATPSSTKPRVNKRLAQGAKSRDEIIDAASRMMSTRGYEGTSVADIARESGLPNSSIYWHFQSKAGILAAVMERGAERFFADVTPGQRPRDESPDDYLPKSFQEVGKVFLRHPEFLRLFIVLALGNDSEEVHEIVARVRIRARASIKVHIASAFQPWGQEVADAVSEELIDFALSAFDGAFLAVQAGSPTDHDTLMEQLGRALLILAHEARARLER